MKKNLLAVTVIATMFASSVMAADSNAGQSPDLGKLRDAAAAPFRFVGNLISGKKAETNAATTKQEEMIGLNDGSANPEEPIFVQGGGTKFEYRPHGQWLALMRECKTGVDCGKWTARIEFRAKDRTQSINLELQPSGDLLSAGVGVLALAQAGAAPGELLAPGEYRVIVSISRNGRESHKMRLGALNVTQQNITARTIP